MKNVIEKQTKILTQGLLIHKSRTCILFISMGALWKKSKLENIAFYSWKGHVSYHVSLSLDPESIPRGVIRCEHAGYIDLERVKSRPQCNFYVPYIHFTNRALCIGQWLTYVAQLEQPVTLLSVMRKGRASWPLCKLYCWDYFTISPTSLTFVLPRCCSLSIYWL